MTRREEPPAPNPPPDLSQASMREAWQLELPCLAEELRRRWHLEDMRQLAQPGGRRTAYVAAAGVGAGRGRAVLEIMPPWERPADAIAALRAWNGVGTPSVLEADVERGALLLEWIEPGVRADPGDPHDVARLLAHLHIPPPAGLPLLAEVVRGRLAATVSSGCTSPAKVDWARAALARLEERPPPAVLLHGDVHDRNLLLCHRRGLVAIGAAPCAGDPAYDAGSWVHARRRQGRRARLDAIVAASGLPRDRVRDWAAIVGVCG